MPIDPTLFVPTSEQGTLRLTPVSPPVAMHLTASGDDAEASMRQMCSGEMPVVGQRYGWVCTGVTTTDGRIQAAFQLIPLDPE